MGRALAKIWKAFLALLDKTWLMRVGSLQALIWVGGGAVGVALVLYAAAKALIQGGFDPASIVLLVLGIVVLAALVVTRLAPQADRAAPPSDPSHDSGSSAELTEPDDLMVAVLELEDDIETLRRRIAHAVPRMVYWRDLLARGVFERHRRTLMERPALFKLVSDSYRWFHELNESVPLGTTIGADDVKQLQAGLRQVEDASAALQALRVEVSDKSSSARSAPAESVVAGESSATGRLVAAIDEMSAAFASLANGPLRAEHARIYTALLRATKAARPDDPLVAAFSEPRESAMRGIFTTTVAEARTGLSIMRTALINTR